MDLEQQVISAAERGDHMAFQAATRRYGTLAEAQQLVRERAIVRMVDRVVPRTLPEPTVREPAETRAEGDDDAAPTMFGHFSVFDEWTEIDSWFEGNFLERIVQGAYRKTFRENAADIRALFQHGYDPVVGDKPLGAPAVLREDDIGAYYEVPLLDAGYVRDDILPGLQAGVYGASFRFRMMREEFEEDPGRSEHNPKGLPERTLKELRVFEFGPVTFPAYPSATAAVRHDTTPPPEDAGNGAPHPDPVGAAARSHLDRDGRRGTPTYSLDRKEAPRWRLP